jgi:hypothetical protein
MGVDYAGYHSLSVTVHSFGRRVLGTQIVGKPDSFHAIANHRYRAMWKNVVRSIHGYNGSPSQQ